MGLNNKNAITKDRATVIINNLLTEIIEKTCMAEQPEAYIPWLKTEIGMTDEEIEELKTLNRFPELEIA